MYFRVNLSVKKKSRRFLKNPEISDYTDYGTITPIPPTPS
jgi:hypothetical protein